MRGFLQRLLLHSDSQRPVLLVLSVKDLEGTIYVSCKKSNLSLSRGFLLPLWPFSSFLFERVTLVIIITHIHKDFRQLGRVASSKQKSNKRWDQSTAKEGRLTEHSPRDLKSSVLSLPCSQTSPGPFQISDKISLSYVALCLFISEASIYRTILFWKVSYPRTEATSCFVSLLGPVLGGRGCSTHDRPVGRPPRVGVKNWVPVLVEH